MSHDLINTQELCAALGLTRDQFKPIEKQLPGAVTVGTAHQKHWPIHILPESVTYKRQPLAVRSPALQAVLKRAFNAGAPQPAAPVPAPAPVKRPPAIRAPISAEQADAEQLICQQARLCILTAARNALATKRAASEAAALDAWLRMLAAGELSPQQVLWSALAHDKNGFRFEVSYATGAPVAIALEGQETEEFAARLTKRTLQRWMSDWKKGGDDALIPGKRVKDMTVPPWAPVRPRS